MNDLYHIADSVVHIRPTKGLSTKIKDPLRLYYSSDGLPPEFVFSPTFMFPKGKHRDETKTVDKAFVPHIEAFDWLKKKIKDQPHSEWIQEGQAGWIAILMESTQRCVTFTLRDHFNRALRGSLGLFLRHKIPRKKGSFIHCAGIHIQGQVFLFIAPSGTGKTTIAMSAKKAGFTVLSDDQVFVCRLGGTFIGHGTPFGTISDGPLTGQIRGIFILRQAAFLSINTARTSNALVQAWVDSYYNATGFNASDRKEVFEQWFDLFSSVRCFEMNFTRSFCEWDKLIHLVA